MKTIHYLMLALIALGGAASSIAQSAPPAPTLAAEFRQFDFWVGDWDVTKPDGKPAGTSKIELVADGAALLENWVGDPSDGGGNGKSLNTYNPAKKQWQQFWVGSGGGVLELTGGLVEGSMVLTGTHGAPGKQLTEKITWTPHPDGSVRQHWEQSRDGGKTWTTAFDGLYRRKEK